MRSAWSETWCSSGDGQVRVRVGPENGRPLVCLHGVTRAWKDWLTIAPALANRWQLFCVDFRGHGKSARAVGKYLVRDYVRDANAVLNTVVKQPAVVCGHSLGAMVAAGVAAEPGSFVRAAILEDPPYQTMGSRIADTPYLSQFVGMRSIMHEGLDIPNLARRLADLEVVHPVTSQKSRLGDLRDSAAIRFHAACLARTDAEVLTPIIEGRWLDGFDVDAIHSALRCPVLLLQADSDGGGMMTEADADQLLSAATDVTRVRFPGVSHQIHATQPEAAARAIVQFLESLD